MQAAHGNIMESFKVRTLSGNLELSCLMVLPEGRPATVLQILHGMCENKEKYIPFMQYLASAGIACVIHDQRGHGASVKDPSELGYMHGGGWEAMAGDAMEVWQSVQDCFNGCRHALLGHSMGSMVAKTLVKKHSAMLDALVLCGCPGYNPWCVPGRLLASAVGKVKGEGYRSRMLQRFAFGSHGGGKDRTGGFIFTADGFQTLIALMREGHSYYGWTDVNRELRVMFASGGDDRYIRSRNAFSRAVNTMTEAGFNDTRTVMYPGMRHDILGAQDCAKVWKDILDFLK